LRAHRTTEQQISNRFVGYGTALTVNSSLNRGEEPTLIDIGTTLEVLEFDGCRASRSTVLPGRNEE